MKNQKAKLREDPRPTTSRRRSELEAPSSPLEAPMVALLGGTSGRSAKKLRTSRARSSWKESLRGPPKGNTS